LSVIEKGDNVKKIVVEGKTIQQRADGRYWTRFRTADGYQKSVYGKTPEEVKSRLQVALKLDKARRKKRAEAQKEAQHLNDKEYLYAWLEFWNETYKIPYNKTDNITRNIRLHIRPNIKNKPLNMVTAIDIQQVINKIEGTKTKQEVYNIFNGAFRVAYTNDFVKKNPCEAVVKVKHIRNKGSALSIAEEKEFLQNIKGIIYEPFFKVCLYAGLRRGEALSLNVNDVKLDENILHVRGTKTTNSDRYIPLFNVLKTIFDSIEPDEDGFYFGNLTESAVTHNFHKICPNHKLHDLRHTFATRCIENGISMKVIQRWLGHASFKTTADIYAEVQDRFNLEESAKINAFFDTHFDTHFCENDQKND